MNKPLLLKPPKQLDDFDLNFFFAKCQQVDAENLEKYQSDNAKHFAILKQIEELYGRASDVWRYVSRRGPSHPQSNSRVVFPKVQRQYNQYLEDKERRERDALRRKQRTDAALLRLETLGYILGTDFNRSHAILFLKKVEDASSNTVSESA